MDRDQNKRAKQRFESARPLASVVPAANVESDAT